MVKEFGGKSVCLSALLLLLAIFCAGCHTISAHRLPDQYPAYQPHHQPFFSLTTYNINWRKGLWGKNNVAKTLSAIKQTDTDVVLLQEVTIPWVGLLQNINRKKYPYRLMIPRTDEGGLAVFSRYPLRMENYFQPKTAWYPAMILKIQSPLGDIQIAHVHLRPPLVAVDEIGFLARGVKATKESRYQEVKEIHQHLQDNLPTIFVGDFNEQPHGKGMQWLLQQGFKGAPHEEEKPFITWYWHMGPLSITRHYDQVLYTSPLKIEHVDVAHVGSSDHFPVRAVFY